MDIEEHSHYYLTYYIFKKIDDPKAEVKKHKNFFKDKGKNNEGEDRYRSRIYIAHEGINAVLSATKKDAQLFMEWLKKDPLYADVWFKLHEGRGHSLPHQTVKTRRQLVGLDIPINIAETAEHISPQKWANMIEEQDGNTIMIDVRNNYESNVGYFEGALKPDLKTFRQFPQYAKDLAKKYDPKKTRVMTYCTGGIRCELYTVLLKNEGFGEVYQLDGGVVNYGHEMGGTHWRGKLFMFDDRLGISMGDESDVVGKCYHCGKSEDKYYNCLAMPCNELFICCSDCAQKYEGCCSEKCQKLENKRPYIHSEEQPKPLRRARAHQERKGQQEKNGVRDSVKSVNSCSCKHGKSA